MSKKWIASKDIQFFHGGIHLLSKRWQKVMDSDGQFFYINKIYFLFKRLFE